MLPILFQDEHIVVVDKPAGLLVHRSRIDIRAREFALQMLRDQINHPVFPVHRIDRPTSGALVFALDPGVAKLLCQQFRERRIEKFYEAIVRGHPPLKGSTDEPLIENHDRITDSLANENKPAQPAITQFETLRSWTVPFSAGKYPHSRYSLVKIKPITGRRHQIRRHFNHMAYPIVGDTTHGDRRHNRLFREQFNIERLLLFAKTIRFDHPVTTETIRVSAERGCQFEMAIEHLENFKHNAAK